MDKEQPKDVPPQLPGSLPTSEAARIPDWYKVGWRAFTDLDAPLEDEDQKQLRLMKSWISQQYYGEWYYNAAVIICVCHSCVHSLSQLMIPSPWSILGRTHISFYDSLQPRVGLALYPSSFV